MLKRIYIDNFRCLVDFELRFDSIHLFLGQNGSGKSTVFEVLRKLQTFVCDAGKISSIFSINDIPRWKMYPMEVFELEQNFELEIESKQNSYEYKLTINYWPELYPKIKSESLSCNQNFVIKFENGETIIYGDNNLEKTRYPSGVNFSNLLNINTPEITDFRGCLERFIIVKINPSLMKDITEKEEVRLSSYMENYASWYRYLDQHYPQKIAKLKEELQEILSSFVDFNFVKSNPSSWFLNVLFEAEKDKQSYPLSLSELSDGQRALIALYTLITCTQSEDYVLCLDEPENFLALLEIQPWLMELEDLCYGGKLQALLISHHPELINILASSVGYWFEWNGANTPVTIKPIKDESETGLSISELIARGWLYDYEEA